MTRYQGQRVAFLTQHGKDSLLQSFFLQRVGCEIERAIGFDTDQLGTFTRDIPRPGSQLAAARTKARKAIELTGYPVGMGSEGAFTGDPVSGLMPWNTEVLVWSDVQNDLEIIGIAQGPGGGFQSRVHDALELKKLATGAGFPAQGLVLRPDGPEAPAMYRGLSDWPTLIAAFDEVVAQSSTASVYVELDLRAHMSPGRQQMILQAAENLLAKLQSACPSCGLPGFWEKERRAGLPCGLCRQPTLLPLARIWRCDACRYTDERHEAPGKTADPSRCNICNP